MANKSLTDLTARTATADSDLLHINSGGTDYKQAKLDFLLGNFQHNFGNTSLLTSQVQALPTIGTYFGTISSYGKQTETGVPQNASFYVKAQCIAYNYKSLEIWKVDSAETAHFINTLANGNWSGYIQVPYRNEITSLNNSLTNSSVTISAGSSAVTITRNYSYRYGNIVFIGVRFKVTSAIAIYGYVLQIPSTWICPTDVYAPLMSSYFTTMDGRGLYLDATTYTFRASSAIPTGDYTFYCPILVGNAS